MKLPDELLFGAAYYYEYLPFEKEEQIQKLDEDLTLMKDAGMNVIRIGESTWSLWEKQEGQYDFSDLLLVIEHAARFNICVIVGTCTYAVPSWLAKKYPSVMLGEGSKKAIYGHRQQFNLMDPQYRRLCAGVIEEMMKACAHFDNVIGFQIDNETHHQSAFNWNVQEAFVKELQQEYGQDFDRFNLDFLMNYWSNSIYDWKDFPDLAGSINASLSSRFEQFRRRMIDDFFQFQIEIINRYKRPEQFITHNFDFGWKEHSYGIHPELNPFQTAKLLDVAGCDIYHPSRYELDGSDISFCGQLTYSLKQRDYLVLETQSGGEVSKLPLPGQLRLCAFAHLANGARMVEYWPWASIHASRESQLYGVISWNRTRDRIYQEAARTGHEFSKYGKELIPLRRKPRIALVTNRASQDQLKEFDWKQPGRSYNAYNDMIRYFADALYHLNQEYMVLDEDSLESLDGFELVIFPAFFSVKESTLPVIRQYTQNGGHILASFFSFQADENLRRFSQPVPYGLIDVFGLEADRGWVIQKQESAGMMEQGYAEEILPLSASSILTTENGLDVLFESRFGAGTAWYLAGEIRADLLEEQLADIVVKSGIPASSLRFPLVVKEGVTAQGTRLVYILNFSADRQDFVSCWKGYSLLDQRTVLNGQPLFLGPWDLMILKLED